MAQFELKLKLLARIKANLAVDREQEGRHWESQTDWTIYRNEVSFLINFVEFLIEENSFLSALKKEYEE